MKRNIRNIVLCEDVLNYAFDQNDMIFSFSVDFLGKWLSKKEIRQSFVFGISSTRSATIIFNDHEQSFNFPEPVKIKTRYEFINDI